MDERGGSQEHAIGDVRLDMGDEQRIPEEPAPPSPGRRPLRRRMHDKVFGGVAGGLADYFGISAFGLRLVFGVSAVVVGFLLLRPAGLPYGMYVYASRIASFRDLVKTGAGVAFVAYFGMWIFVPAEDQDVSAVRRVGRRLPRLSWAKTWVAMLAFIAGATVLGTQLGLWSGDIIWAFLLIGAGVLLFRRDAERVNGRARTEVADTPGTGSLAAPAAPTDPGSRATAPAPIVTAPALVLPPRTPRERSPLGWLVIGIAMLAVGGAAILQNLGALHLQLVRFPALALLVLGLGMLVGTVVGRARWLLLPSIVLAPIVLASSLIHVPLEGGFGSIYEVPIAVANVHGAYRAVVGDVSVDLQNLACQQNEIALSESTGFGNVYLAVPFDAHVVVTGSVGLGAIQLEQFANTDGTEQHLERTLEPRFGDGITVIADLESGIGNVSVY
ncbi:MAG: PspC domain-containing protein, partial [Actinomycetota bacterium]|nr:PspC domain-containing protein [Actinomycetota bacterium]